MIRLSPARSSRDVADRERLETEVVAIRGVNPGRNPVRRERQVGKGYLAGAVGPLADRDQAAGLIGGVKPVTVTGAPSSAAAAGSRVSSSMTVRKATYCSSSP